MRFLIRNVRVILSSCHPFISLSLMGHNENADILQSLKIFPHDSKFMPPALLLDHCERDKTEPL